MHMVWPLNHQKLSLVQLSSDTTLLEYEQLGGLVLWRAKSSRNPATHQIQVESHRCHPKVSFEIPKNDNNNFVLGDELDQMAVL